MPRNPNISVAWLVALCVVAASCTTNASVTSKPDPTQTATATAGSTDEVAEVQVKPLDCGDSSVAFSVSGALITCEDHILAWPTLGEEAALPAGGFLGWGTVGGADYALVEDAGQVVVIGPDGGRRQARFRAHGRTAAIWSPDRDSVLIAAGLGTQNVYASQWNPLDGAPSTKAFEIRRFDASNVVESQDGKSFGIFDRAGCSASGGGGNCANAAAVAGQADVVMYFGVAGSIVNAWIGNSGRLSVTTSGSTGLTLWSAASDERHLSVVASNVGGVWEAGPESLTLVKGQRLLRYDVSTGNLEKADLPPDVDAADVIGVSDDGRSIATFDAGAATVTFWKADGQAQGSVPIASVSRPSVAWSPDAIYALVYVGPPAATLAVTLPSPK